MSEVDIAEDLPNGDDSAFADDPQHDGSGDASSSVVQTVDTDNSTISSEHVYVATSQGLLTATEHYQETNGLKTTHIVIHDQTLTVDSNGLKTPTTPLPPPTPATPLSREKGLKYQWDDSVHMTILPVRCKHTNGELHKAKFGSGMGTSGPKNSRRRMPKNTTGTNQQLNVFLWFYLDYRNIPISFEIYQN